MQRFFAFLFLWLAAGSFALPGASSVSAAEPVQIVVKGVEGDALANVRAALKLPAGIVKDNQVNMPWLERFRGQIPGKVHDALVPFGFYDSIAIVEMETEVEGSYILKVNISPGRAVMVTDSEVTIRGPGASENNLLKLSRSFPLKKGDILRQDVYEISKGAIKSAAISLGYLDADFSVHKIFVSKENYSARVVLELETGPRYMFGKASFQDMSGYPEGFLRRYLAFKPGDVFSYDKLSQTHLNLINSDRFSDVVISPRKESAADERVPVEIKLVPSPSKRLKMGVGYGTDTGARFSGQYKDLNILDKGNELAADISLSQRVQGIDTSYTIPGEKIDSSTSFKASFKKEHVTTYRSKQLSLEADRTRSLGGGRLGTAYVRLLREDSTVGSDSVRVNLIMPGVRLSEQKYNDIIHPSKGYRYALEARGTGTFMGSDTDMVQVLAEGSLLVKLPWQLSLHTRLKGAATFLGADINKLPASLRFFAGGDRSVRGYAYQSLGPKDENGNVEGGKNLLVGSVELERAVTENIGLAVFYDAGNAFNSLSHITLFQGAGVGVRYYTQVGAISLDIARQIGVDNPRFRLHIMLGYGL